MASDFYSRDEVVERASVPLDIDDVHMLLQGRSPSSDHKVLNYSWAEVLMEPEPGPSGMHRVLWRVHQAAVPCSCRWQVSNSGPRAKSGPQGGYVWPVGQGLGG